MMCPKCAGKTTVNGVIKGTVNNRFRKCLNCGYTFQTVEAVKFDDYWKDYAAQAYETNKKEFAKKSEDDK
ncbi:MAG: hypothetical protein ACK5LP_07770 [Campylobacteraceae bacterium]